MRTTHQLEEAVSDRLLAEAVTARSAIVLEFDAMPGRTVNGTLLSCDEDAMLVEVSGRPPFEWSKLKGESCEARIYHDQRYIAETRVLDVPTWGNTLGLALARPAALRVLDRRRFLRAKLAPSSKVEIQWKVAGAQRRHTVSLLNVSADGMACKLEDEVATGLDKRRRLRVGFDLPGGGHRIELDARVTNLTPASAGSSIMGLQFITSEADAASVRALRMAIERAESTAMAEEEVHT